MSKLCTQASHDCAQSQDCVIENTVVEATVKYLQAISLCRLPKHMHQKTQALGSSWTHAVHTTQAKAARSIWRGNSDVKLTRKIVATGQWKNTAATAGHSKPESRAATHHTPPPTRRIRLLATIRSKVGDQFDHLSFRVALVRASLRLESFPTLRIPTSNDPPFEIRWSDRLSWHDRGDSTSLVGAGTPSSLPSFLRSPVQKTVIISTP